MQSLVLLLTVLLGASPLLLAALVGIVVALLLRRRASRPALLMLVACVVQLAVTLVGVWMQAWWLPAARAAGGLSLQGLTLVMGLWATCSSLLHAAAFGLLIWAACAGRPKARVVPPPIG